MLVLLIALIKKIVLAIVRAVMILTMTVMISMITL